ncbi:MAG: hypothetical protein ACE5J9_05925 [Methanosarcinales archaeon]
MNRIKITLFTLILSILILLNCNTRDKNNNISNKPENMKVQSVNKGNETRLYLGKEEQLDKPFIVKENTVLFLVISQDELDSLKEDKIFGVEEVLSDFYHYSDKAADVLKKHGINPIMTTSKNIIFQYSDGEKEKYYFDAKKEIIGTIFFAKGKKPRMYFEIMSDDLILQKASDYFGIDFSKK